jgi:hypothetical protein
MSKHKAKILKVTFLGLVGASRDEQDWEILGLYPDAKPRAADFIDQQTRFFLGQNEFWIEISRDDFDHLVYYKARSTSVMPCIYKPPLQLPFFWMDCQDEVLHAAIRAYFEHKANHAAPSPEQIQLIADYLDHFIHAPCWVRESVSFYVNGVQAAREQVKKITSVAGIDKFLKICMDCAIDPF